MSWTTELSRRLLRARTPTYPFGQPSETEYSAVSSNRRSTCGSRAFSVAGLTVWNSLPDLLHDPAVDSESFRRDFKTHLFCRTLET